MSNPGVMDYFPSSVDLNPNDLFEESTEKSTEKSTAAAPSRSEASSQSQPQPQEAAAPPETQEWIGAFANKSNWPSPVVYPLRPQKRRQSLAAVELPSFPKAQC
jgi:hypothetical protein